MKKQTVRPAEGLNARFERKMRNSFLARFLLFLGGLQDSLQKSAVGGFFRKLGKRLNVEGRFLRPFKYTFAREIEQSLIFNAIDRFFKLLLILPLRVYGTFALTFSVYNLGISLVKNYVDTGTPYSVSVLVSSAASILISGMLLFLGRERTLGRCAIESRLASFFLFDLLGVHRQPFEQEPYGKSGILAAFLAGTVFSLLTVFVPGRILLEIVLWAVFVYLAFSEPEAGFLSVLFFLPVLSSVRLKAMVFLVALSFFVKLLRGKRTMNMSFFGLVMAAFGVLAFLSSSTATEEQGTTFGMMFVLFLGFFAGALFFDKEEWFNRATAVLSFSAVLSALWCVFVYGAGFIPLKYELLQRFIPAMKWPAGFSGMEEAGVYLAVAVALLVVRYLSNRRMRNRFFSGWALLFLAAGALLSKYTSAWLALLVAVVMLFVLHKNINIFAGSVLSAALVVSYRLFLPKLLVETGWEFSLRTTVEGKTVASQFSESFSRLFIGAGEGAVLTEENFYSHLLTSFGLFGLLFFLFVLFGAIAYSFTACSKNVRINKEIRWLLCGCNAAVYALLTAGFFMDLFRYEKLIFLFFFLLGLIFGCGRMLKTDGEQQLHSSETDVDFYFVPVVQEPKRNRSRFGKGRKKRRKEGSGEKRGSGYSAAVFAEQEEEREIRMLPEDEPDREEEQECEDR